MNICIIGMGYVGLVTGAVFADLGNDVIGVDKDKGKIEVLRKGLMPIYEPGLEEIVRRNMDEGRLSFTTETALGVKKSEIIFIAVGTPPKDDGETDLSFVESAAAEIGQTLDGVEEDDSALRYKIVVNKSTVPVGTGALVSDIIEKYKRNTIPCHVVSNPEFLREGSAIADALHPDRIIIGAPNREVAMRLIELYAVLERPMIITSVRSAEMIKYASNAFLATKISFVNAMANLCELVGADVDEVAKGMGYDPRIGRDFLRAGLGFGGSCFPKDILSLIHVSDEYDYDLKMLKSVVEVNEGQPARFLAKIRQEMGDLRGKTVGILGLAFKPNTDDMREAVSISIISSMLANGTAVKAYDPVAMENAKKIFPHLTYCHSAYEVAEGAQGLVVVTEWNEFRQLNMDKIKSLMKEPLIFDGRNIYDPQKMKSKGFKYYGVGRYIQE